MAELNEQQKQFAEQLQKSINENTFAPETLDNRKLKAVDYLIKNNFIKSKPLETIINERNKAREDIAKIETTAKDPLAAYLGMDDSAIPGGDFLLSGRSSAVIAGDLSASFMAANYMRDHIANAYKKTGMQNLKLTQGRKFFFENFVRNQFIFYFYDHILRIFLILEQR